MLPSAIEAEGPEVVSTLIAILAPRPTDPLSSVDGEDEDAEMARLWPEEARA